MRAELARGISRLWPLLRVGSALPIGLHIGLDHLTLVQMQRRGAGAAFRAAASIKYDCARSELLADPPQMKALIGRALAEQPFRGRRVVSCLPNDQLKLMVVNFNAAEGEADADAVVRELKLRVRGELEGKIVDFVLVRQRDYPPRSNEAIVAMAERERVTAYLDLLSGCGLEIEALEIGPVAMTRLVSSIRADAGDEIPNLLLITFGSRSSYLTVVWGRRLMLDRGVDFAERQLLSRLGTVLDMPEQTAKELLLERGFIDAGTGAEESEVGRMLKEVLRPALAALKVEVAKTLSYTASKTHGRSVDAIYVAGSLARYPGIDAFLQENFNLPVRVLNPFSIFPHSLKPRDLEHLWPHAGIAVATGLALRGVLELWPS